MAPLSTQFIFEVLKLTKLNTREVIFCFALLIEYLVSQVMSIKAIRIAIRLTIEGADQFVQFQTWIFTMVAISCIVTQLNYLNMVCITLNFYVSIMFCIWNIKLEPGFIFSLEEMIYTFCVGFLLCMSCCLFFTWGSILVCRRRGSYFCRLCGPAYYQYVFSSKVIAYHYINQWNIL